LTGERGISERAAGWKEKGNWKKNGERYEKRDRRHKKKIRKKLGGKVPSTRDFKKKGS